MHGCFVSYIFFPQSADFFAEPPMSSVVVNQSAFNVQALMEVEGQNPQPSEETPNEPLTLADFTFNMVERCDWFATFMEQLRAAQGHLEGLDVQLKAEWALEIFQKMVEQYAQADQEEGEEGRAADPPEISEDTPAPSPAPAPTSIPVPKPVPSQNSVSTAKVMGTRRMFVRVPLGKPSKPHRPA